MTETEQKKAVMDAMKAAVARWQCPEFEIQQMVGWAMQAVEKEADRHGVSPAEALAVGREAALVILSKDSLERAREGLLAWVSGVPIREKWADVVDLLRQIKEDKARLLILDKGSNLRYEFEGGGIELKGATWKLKPPEKFSSIREIILEPEGASVIYYDGAKERINQAGALELIKRWYSPARSRPYRAIQPAKGFLRAPTVQHAHVLAGALVRPSEHWEFDEEQALIKLSDGSAWIPFQSEEGPQLLSTEVMATLAARGPECLKLMLACFNYWVEHAPTGAEWHTPIVTSLGDLLRYMGYADKGHSPEELRDMGKQLFALSRIWTRSRSVRGRGRRRKKVQYWETFRPLIILLSVGFQKSLFAEKNDLSTATEVKYFLGEDWYNWLYGENKLYGLFNSKLLQYSAQNDQMPLLLGWYLSWLFRVRLRQANPPIHWKTLLEGAYIEWPAHPNNYARFLERVEAALDRLKIDGVIGGWTPQYNKAREAVRAILEHGTVQIDPPADLLAAYRQATNKLLPPPPAT